MITLFFFLKKTIPYLWFLLFLSGRYFPYKWKLQPWIPFDVKSEPIIISAAAAYERYSWTKAAFSLHFPFHSFRSLPSSLLLLLHLPPLFSNVSFSEHVNMFSHFYVCLSGPKHLPFALQSVAAAVCSCCCLRCAFTASAPCVRSNKRKIRKEWRKEEESIASPPFWVDFFFSFCF